MIRGGGSRELPPRKVAETREGHQVAHKVPGTAIAPEGDVQARLKAVAERNIKDTAVLRGKILRGETRVQQIEAEEARRREEEARQFQAALHASRAADHARQAGTRMIQNAATTTELKRGARILQEAVTTGIAAKLEVAHQLNPKGMNGRGGGEEGPKSDTKAERASRRVLAMVWNPDARSVSPIEEFQFNREADRGYDRRQVLLPVGILTRAEYLVVDTGHSFTAHYRKLTDQLARIDANQSFHREKSAGGFLANSPLRALEGEYFEKISDNEWEKVPQDIKDADGTVVKAKDFADFLRPVA